MITRIVLAIVVVAALGLGAWVYVFEKGMPGLPQAQAPQEGGVVAGSVEYVENEEFYLIRASYPAQTPLAGAADAQARTTIEEGIMQRVEAFKDTVEEFLTPEEQERVREMGGRYELGMEYRAYGAPDHVSYVYTVYEDMMGAHPNAYFITFVFDEEGNKVELADLLAGNPNWLEEVSLNVSNGVVAQIKERLGDSLPQGDEGPDVTGSVFEEGLAPQEENFKNFYLDGPDLVVIIPPYQAAAWAMGSFEVRMPLEGMQ